MTSLRSTSLSGQSPVTLVLPVKELVLAKTRVGLPGPDRAELALHLFRHTLNQVYRSPLVGQIVLVTRDPRVIEIAGPFDVAVAPEPEASDLNLAAERGHDHAHSLLPEAGVAVMVSDLPYLITSDVTAYLDEFLAQGEPMYVADHLGTGTTTVVQPASRRLPYRFGPDSAERHRRAGYRPTRGNLLSLRTDLDTPEDLTFLQERDRAAERVTHF